ERAALTRRLNALIAPPGFTGKAPGGPSRWSTERSAEWQPLEPALVVEVRYDQVTGDRFRHGTALLRWRPDKAPEDCRFDQLERAARPSTLINDVLERYMTTRAAETSAVAGVRLTHPDKVLYAEQGITKQDLADYYLAVADRMLPHVTERP